MDIRVNIALPDQDIYSIHWAERTIANITVGSCGVGVNFDGKVGFVQRESYDAHEALELSTALSLAAQVVDKLRQEGRIKPAEGKKEKEA